MKNISSEVPYNNCCGCGACYNTCPKGAITMTENEEGFLVPVVESTTCVDCGLCLKACPALNDKRENNPAPDCYAAQAPDPIREVSSSGGVFTLLAEEILNRGGYVCGAAFADDWSVHHIIINNKDDLSKLRGSKYVQSNTGKCYSEIRKLLKADNWVLFSGTPCQVAGLYTYLPNKYDKLITVDVFCHGAPSPGVWRKFLNTNYVANNIDKVNFRDKAAIGWTCSHVTVTCKDGIKDINNNYTKWFHESVILRPSCENCRYSKLPRPADISLGDWWGISKIAPQLNDGKGLSNVLLNSNKGSAFYGTLSNLTLSEKLQLPDEYNNGNIRNGLPHNREREAFFSDTVRLDSHKATAISMRKKYDVCYVSNFYGMNYGAMLVHYAGYKILSDLGYSVLMLDRVSDIFQDYHRETHNVMPYAFARRHYNDISAQFRAVDDLAHLNNICSAFVVGSDQIFNPGLNMDSIAYLQFVRKDKLKIAFGTSFGHDCYRCSYERLHKNKSLLQRFDSIALREVTNHLVRDLFEIKATEIIDPTMVLPVNHFHKLADSVKNLDVQQPYLLTYILDYSTDKETATVHIAEKLGLRIINIASANWREWKFNETSRLKCERIYTPEEFLALFRSASFVVTDSFHGTCFSVIFRRKFVSLISYKRGLMRYKVFDKLRLTGRFYESARELKNTDKWLIDVDYSVANVIIKRESKKARNWLNSALTKVRRKKSINKLRNAAHWVRDILRKIRGVHKVEK